MQDALLYGIAILRVICLLGMVIGVLYNSADRESKIEFLQPVPTVPSATLPVHESSVRALRKLKPAEALPEPLVEADFDPDGASRTRDTRLRELIRDTQSKA